MEGNCIYMNLSSRGQSTRNNLSPWGLGDALTNSYAKNLRYDETFHKPSDLDASGDTSMQYHFPTRDHVVFNAI